MGKYVRKFARRHNITIEYILCSIIIICIGLRNIYAQTSPAILLDEYGYWASGAAMAGIDWSGITSQLCPYYSYGVGIVLSFIMRIVDNPAFRYRIAIGLNIMLVCGQFYILSFLFTKIFSERKKFFVIFLCFIVQFLPSVLVYSQFVWTEIPLSFLFILSLYFLFKLYKTEKVRYYIAMAIVLASLYMVHQRALGILLTGIAVILLIFFRHKKNKKGFLLFLLILMILLLGSHLLKRQLDIILWNNTSQNLGVSADKMIKNVNTYNGVWERVKGIFSLEGIRNIAVGVLGKMYYSACSTFFLFFEGIYFAFGYIVKNFKSKNDKWIFYGYIVCSYFSMVGIASIYFIYYGRIDQLIYGRYVDWVLLPIVILGVMNIRKEKMNVILARFLIYTIAFLLVSLLLFDTIQEKKLISFFGSCAPFAYIFQKDAESLEWFYFMALTVVLISLCLVIALNRTRFFSLFVGVVIVFFSLRLSNSVIEKEFDNADREKIQDMVEILENTDAIYYLYENEDNVKQNQLVGSLQFCIRNTIHCIGENVIPDINEGLIIRKTEANEKDCIYQDDVFQIVEVK